MLDDSDRSWLGGTVCGQRLVELFDVSLKPVGTLGNHRSCGCQNRFGGAIVFGQDDKPDCLICIAEVQDIADIGTLESVNRLVIITDDKDIRAVVIDFIVCKVM